MNQDKTAQEIVKARQLVGAGKLGWDDYDALLFSFAADTLSKALRRRTDIQTDYRAYINSPEWKRKADAAKERAGYRCQVCNKGRDEGARLEAHHRTYDRLGREKPEDITVLCSECHELFSTQ
jgi:5-methylcytosine-specific restriction endonuclease McrA